MILLSDLELISKRFCVFWKEATHSQLLKYTIKFVIEQKAIYLTNFEKYSFWDIDFKGYLTSKFGLTDEQFEIINVEINERKTR